MNKRCSECGITKDTSMFPPSLSGHRLAPYCGRCESLMNEPRKQPKIKGKNRPVFGVKVKTEEEEVVNRSKTYKFKGSEEMKKSETGNYRERIKEYVKTNTDCTVKDIIPICTPLSYHSVYQHLQSMVNDGVLVVERIGKSNVYRLTTGEPKPGPAPGPVKKVTPDMVLPQPSPAEVMDKSNIWWGVLKNRLIRAGEITALQVMVEIEEGD